VRPSATLIVALALLSSAAPAAGAQPEVVRVLAMGRAIATPILHGWLVTEPSTDPVIIPTREWGAISEPDIRRYMRIYFPRSYDSLLGYKFFFLAQVDMYFVSPEQARWMYDALRDHPRGAVNTRSIMSNTPAYYEEWRNSMLPEAFPNDIDAVIAYTSTFKVKPGPLIVKDDPALPAIMRPYKIPIESSFTLYGAGEVNTVPRPGSVVLSYVRNDAGVGSPIPGQVAHVFYWNWNRSTTFTFMDRPQGPFWNAPVTNPYALDMIINMIWFSTGRDLPQDPLLVQDYRRMAFDYGIQRTLLGSLLEFAEIFGADSSGIYARMDEIDEQRRRAARDYLGGEYAAAHESMGVALADLKALEDDAMRLKDSALFWVYAVQWLATTGTFLGAAVVLWSLMVRRSLYREVSSTKWAR
jgi:hypothetical protein